MCIGHYINHSLIKTLIYTYGRGERGVFNTAQSSKCVSLFPKKDRILVTCISPLVKQGEIHVIIIVQVVEPYGSHSVAQA